MKQIKIFLLFLFLTFSYQVFAIDAPENVKLDKAYEDSLEISWDQIENIGAYAVSYGTKSVSGSEDNYEHEREVVVSESKAKIENLSNDTIYYIAVKAYDDEQNESDYSKEVNFKTLAALESLKVGNIDLIDTRNINVNFNLNLKKDSLVDVNLVNKNDESNSISVEKYDIDKNVLKIFLAHDLEKSTKYNLTILALEGENGESIKEGVNGESEFDVPEDLRIYSEEEQELNSAEPEQNQKQDQEEKKETKVLGGKDVKTDNSKNVEKIAKEKKKLPTTGPAETLLFLIFAFIASGLFFVLRNKFKKTL